ncbi:MAG: hypothetical protein IJZ16_01560 [Clostridia bacterium]|nr:hypothetical protein [Clostridia bacterium]
MKKIMATILSVVLMLSSFSVLASAQTYFYLGRSSYSYDGNKYCLCKLNKPGKKNATVVVKLYSTGPLTIKMTDGNGRWLWEESRSIKVNSFDIGSRKYNLGKNHSAYRLYFKSTYNGDTGVCQVTSPKNCTIS